MMSPVGRIARCLVTTIALGAVALLPAAAPAAGGKPVVEREVFEETFFDEFILDICGIATFTTVTERRITKTYPDGSMTVHVVVTFDAEDPRIPFERGAFTDFVAPDGTETTVGLPIQLSRKGEGIIIRDAGWVQFRAEGPLVRGPHPFLEVDPADVYC